MTPNIYIDLHIRDRRTGLPTIGKIVSILHEMQRREPNLLAIAFPKLRKGVHRYPGDLIRVFSSSLENMARIKTRLIENKSLQRKLDYSEPKQLPDDFKGPWVEYRRFRVPNTDSRLEKCRDYRLKASEEIPFIRVVSRSNGHGFSLFIDIRDGNPCNECTPDSYGLSVATRPFALPFVDIEATE